LTITFSSPNFGWPFSLAYIRLVLSQAMPCTLRWPSDQTSESLTGLPGAGLPAGVIRRILPARLLGFCACVPLVASPVVA